ncbi:MAG: UDP-glucose/GDP-mannose dehydrogenase family protein [Rickettsiales bacterium]
MRIAIFGAGYVGLTSAACFAHIGHRVSLIDASVERMAALRRGETPIYEEDLSDLLRSPNVSFARDAREALREADVALIAVGTPHDPESGATDMRQVFAVAEEMAALLTHRVTVVTKSTVPVGTAKKLQAFFDGRRPDLRIDCASNPEFLREGRAIKDFLEPDRIVVGAESPKAKEDCLNLYKPITDKGYPIYCYGAASAEAVKYASNGFLAIKIAYVNEIADFCERTGADVDEVAEGMGADLRIGRQFLRPGPGYGGSCFPKDTRSLKAQAQRAGAEARLIEAAISSNERRPAALLCRAKDKLAGGDWKGKRIGMLGAAFKGETDDVRESPALALARILCEEGAHVAIYDPQALKGAKNALAGHASVVYAADWQEAAKGADIVVIATEWKEFSRINLKDLAALTQPDAALFDARGMIDGESAAKAGLRYVRVGKS